MSHDIFRPQIVAAETDKTAEPQRATVMKSLIQTLRTQQAVASAEADQLGFLIQPGGRCRRAAMPKP